MRLIDADKLKKHYAWWNNEQQRDFDAIVDAQPTELRWIRSEDRVPETPGFYLVTKRQRSGQLIIAIGHYSGTSWSGSGNFTDVTRWMPLPEVPE